MNYAIKDAADVILYKKNNDGTKTPVLFTDYANSTSLEFGADRIFATAKGVNKVAFDTNKNGTFSMEMEVFDIKWLSVLLGAIEDSSIKEYAKREVLTVDGSNQVTLGSTPKAGTVAVFTLENDLRSHKVEIAEGVATNPGEFGISGSTVTFNNADAPQSTKVVVYYMTDTAGAVKSFKVTDSKYAEAYAIHGDTMLRSELGTDQFIQLRIPNCRPQGSFSVAFSASDVATLSATFDILADETGDMIEFIYIS